ncbi:MAG: tRNA uridine(34) 5-carboxymethylaminomethyl modification radical SAM/GNAT enzyme Elp3 [Candidatus Micrarchaeota archaeon]
MDAKAKAISYIIDKILNGETNLEKLKRQASVKFCLNKFIKNTSIVEKFPKNKFSQKIIKLLKRKPVRTLSGVTPIAVMIAPENSCRWNCIYCPYTGKAPKSYTGSEPAALRARSNGFDPIKQIKTRLKQFKLNCHKTEKCDVIIMGGTFLSTPFAYQENFVKSLYDTLNADALNNDILNNNALNEEKLDSLENAKRRNETSAHRMVGLTIETRPDVCGQDEINRMLKYGVTKVELGVQHISNSIYKIINRGHFVSHVIEATKLLRDSAFKIAYHIMIGLPGSSPKKDIEMFKKIFSDKRFRPDMLKIYPTLIIPGTHLYEMMKKEEYDAYSTEDAAQIIVSAYRYIPKYVRVMRIQRDIPSNLIADGVRKSNLREIVERKAASLGINIREIRYRETGLSAKPIVEPVFMRTDYSASGGEEIFLSVEDKINNTIAAFIRVRIPNSTFRPEITDKTALVRELHVYGEETLLGKKGSVQHRGFGSSLLAEAEKIASEEFDKKKMVILSAVGVRPYYYKRGYFLDGPYVSKF